MFLPYWLSVIILSLALYGIWHFCRDIGGLWRLTRQEKILRVSLLIIFNNAEDTVEGWVRQLLRRLDLGTAWQEVVVVDHGSDDLTPAILSRLAIEDCRLKFVHLPPAARAIAEGLAFCQGDIVQVIDMESRVGVRAWEEAIDWLLRQ